MPTRAKCALCKWAEDFKEHGEAKQAMQDHDCQIERDVQLPKLIRDVSWENSELEQ